MPIHMLLNSFIEQGTIVSTKENKSILKENNKKTKKQVGKNTLILIRTTHAIEAPNEDTTLLRYVTIFFSLYGHILRRQMNWMII